MADYALGQDIPYAMVGTLPEDLSRREALSYWLVMEPLNGVELAADTARVSLVHEDGTSQDITSQIEVRQEDALVAAGTDDLLAIAPDLLPTDTLRLECVGHLSQDATYGLAQGNRCVARLEWSGSRQHAIRTVVSLISLLAASTDPVPAASGLTRSAEMVTTVHTYQLQVEKRAKSAGTPLEGARFALRDANGLWYTGKGWSESKQDARELSTNSEGKLTFTGVDSEEYELVETAAPAGFDAVDSLGVRLDATITSNAPELRATTDAASVAVDVQTGVVTVCVDDPESASAPGSQPGSKQDSQPGSKPASQPSSNQADKSSDITPAAALWQRLAATGDQATTLVALEVATLGIALVLLAREVRKGNESKSAK